MALADSVPGVSGGTIAFIMGFYDKFIGSVHDIVFERGITEKRKEAFFWLVKLLIGWGIGMALAALVLTKFFDTHIYVVSSLFIGFVIAAIPVICHEEWENVRKNPANGVFLLIGLALVVLITVLRGSVTSSFDLASPDFLLFVFLLIGGMAAISAMFLPGISGSTLLLVFGLYVPVMTAVRGLLHLNFAYLPGLIVFGIGVLVGAASVVKGIRVCLERFRPQTIYMILGMMVGSLYAIVTGPTTIDAANAALDPSNFCIPAFIVGILLIAALEAGKHFVGQNKGGNSGSGGKNAPRPRRSTRTR